MPEPTHSHNTEAVHLVPFLFDTDTLVRTVIKNGEPWFISTDVCHAIGIKNNRDAVEPLDADEKGVVLIATSGGPQELLVISEGGLYTLILRSRAATTPGTKHHAFRRWVTTDLLPSIRKTGRHSSTSTPSVGNPHENDGWKLKQVAEARLTFGTRAAAKVWISLGLTIVPEMYLGADQMEIPLDYSAAPASATIN